MRFSVCFISLLLGTTVATQSAAMTKEELRSRTEEVIRNQRERKTRLQSDTLLDQRGQLYSDGKNVYPGILIRNQIFPAMLASGQRQPGCLLGNTVIKGTYNAQEQLVVCLTETGKNTKQFGHHFVVKEDARPAPASATTGRAAEVKTGTAPAKNRLSKGPQQRPGKGQKQAQERPAPRSRPKNNTDAGNSELKHSVELNPFGSRKKFGIRAGTWVRVFLPRKVSSSETADIELELAADLFGTHRKLPTGTIFFARHRINPVTQRLDMDLSLMVLPGGEEYAIIGTVHGTNKAAGLAGAIITHSDRIADLSVKSGVLETTKEELSRQTPGNPGAALAGGVAQDVLQANQRTLPRAPNFSVEVSPGDALVRFGRSF